MRQWSKRVQWMAAGAAALLAALLICGVPLTVRWNRKRAEARGTAAFRQQIEFRAAQARIVLAHNPNNAAAHRDLAWEYGQLRNREAQLREWEEAARLEPENYDTQFSLGTQLVLNHRRNEAIPVLTAVVQSNSKWSATAKWWLAKATGRKTSAAPEFPHSRS